MMRPPPLLFPEVVAPELEPLRLLDESEINPLYRSSVAPSIKVDPSKANDIFITTRPVRQYRRAGQ
jgi:hypothetical protein